MENCLETMNERLEELEERNDGTFSYREHPYLITTLTTREVWSSMSIMINSMKVFGYCFKPQNFEKYDLPEQSMIRFKKNLVKPSEDFSGKARQQNFGDKSPKSRLERYSLVAVVIMWANCIRIFALYTGSDVYGIDLCWKLVSSIWFFSAAFNHTAMYVAWKRLDIYGSLGVTEEPGNLEKVYRNGQESKNGSKKEDVDYLLNFAKQRRAYMRNYIKRISFFCSAYCWCLVFYYVVLDCNSYFIVSMCCLSNLPLPLISSTLI